MRLSEKIWTNTLESKARFPLTEVTALKRSLMHRVFGPPFAQDLLELLRRNSTAYHGSAKQLRVLPRLEVFDCAFAANLFASLRLEFRGDPQ